MCAGALLLAPSAADAARCPKGLIYRPSLGVCQTIAAAQRAGLRVSYVRVKKVKRARPAPRQPVYRVTFENMVWNYVEANRQMLIDTAPN